MRPFLPPWEISQACACDLRQRAAGVFGNSSPLISAHMRYWRRETTQKPGRTQTDGRKEKINQNERKCVSRASSGSRATGSTGVMDHTTASALARCAPFSFSQSAFSLWHLVLWCHNRAVTLECLGNKWPLPPLGPLCHLHAVPNGRLGCHSNDLIVQLRHGRRKE